MTVAKGRPAPRALDILAAARRDGSVDLGGLKLDLDPAADTLVVACSGLNPPGHATYAHEHTELDRRTSRLYVSDRSNRWYLGGVPGLTGSLGETLDLMDAIIAQVPAARRIALGTSMGGYLALLLGGRGSVDNAVAFAPQTTIDAGWRDRLGDRRWSDELRDGFAAHGSAPAPDVAAMPPVPRRRLHLFYPTGDSLDVAHATRLDAQPGVFLYPVRTRHHTLSRFLKQRGVLRHVIAEIIDGRVPLQSIEALGDDPNDPEVAFHLGEALLERGALVEAEAAFRRAVAADPSPSHYHHGLAQAVWRQGRADEATAIAAGAAATLHTDAYAQHNFGLFLLRQGRLSDAEAKFRAAIWLEPREGRFFEDLMRLLARQNRVAELISLRAEARAWVRDPDDLEKRLGNGQPADYWSS